MDKEIEGNLSEEELTSLFQSISNWGRWGENDQCGTLNYITAHSRQRGLAEAREGLTISCGIAIQSAYSTANRNPQMHMLQGGDLAPEKGYGAAFDFIGFAPHGPTYTHLDALCHVFMDRVMYNGRPASLVTSSGARANSIIAAQDGILTRGVLLDIPPVRGVEYIEPERPVTRSELEAAADFAGLAIEEGDALLIRLGRNIRKRIEGPACETLDGATHLPGLAPECLTWLHEQKISLLGSDAAHDALPSPYKRIRSPIHVGALVFMGLHLLDNAELDALSEACASRKKWSFLFLVAPLKLEGATCSPVNPLACL